MRADKQARDFMPAEEHVDLAVEVFRMLSDATRVRLLWALLNGERPVNELAETVGKSPAGVSQHLAKLRMARLVRPRRQGNQVFYRIENSHVSQLVEDAIYHVEHTSGGSPEHHRAGRAHVEPDPFLVRVSLDRLQHQIPRHGVEEDFHIQVNNPVPPETPLPAHPHRVQR